MLDYDRISTNDFMGQVFVDVSAVARQRSDRWLAEQATTWSEDQGSLGFYASERSSNRDSQIFVGTGAPVVQDLVQNEALRLVFEIVYDVRSGYC